MKSFYPLIGKLFLINFSIASVESASYLLVPYLEGRGLAVGVWSGWIMGICYAVSMLSRPFVAVIAEKIRLRIVLALGTAFLVLSGVAYVLGPVRLEAVLFARVLTGLGFSFSIVSLTAYQTLSVPGEIRGRAFSLISAGYALPPLVVFPLLEWLLLHGRERLYVLSIPLLAAIGLGLTLTLKAARTGATGCGDRTEKKAAASFLEVFREPLLICLLASITVFALSDAAMVSFAFLAREKGLPASPFFLSSALVSIVIRFGLNGILDRLPRGPVAMACTCVTSFALLLSAFGNTCGHHLICGAIFGTGMGFGFPAHLCLIGDLAEERLRSRVSALFWFFYSCCFFIAPPLMSMMAGFMGYGRTFGLYSGMLLMMVFCLLLPLFRKTGARSPVPNGKSGPDPCRKPGKIPQSSETL